MASSADREKITADWLKRVFNDEPVPKFNRTPEFTTQLYSLMLRHRALLESIEAYKTFSSASREHVVNDEREASMLLNRCAVGSMLEQPTLEVEQLAKLANTLSLSSTEDSSYILALSELSLEKEQTTSRYELYKRSIASKEKELASAINTAKRLENIVSREQQKEADSKKTVAYQENQAPFLRRKVSKYESDKRRYDRLLNESALRTDLTHDRLVENYSELKSLESQLDQTSQQLDMYADLPPDRELAKVKLAVAKADLQELDEALVKRCDLYHL